MATYNEIGSGAIGIGGVSPVVYEANVTASGGVEIISRAAVSQTAQHVPARIGPSVALLVGGTVTVTLDRDPDPQ